MQQKSGRSNAISRRAQKKSCSKRDLQYEFLAAQSAELDFSSAGATITEAPAVRTLGPQSASAIPHNYWNLKLVRFSLDTYTPCVARLKIFQETKFERNVLKQFTGVYASLKRAFCSCIELFKQSEAFRSCSSSSQQTCLLADRKLLLGQPDATTGSRMVSV